MLASMAHRALVVMRWLAISTPVLACSGDDGDGGASGTGGETSGVGSDTATTASGGGTSSTSGTTSVSSTSGTISESSTSDENTSSEGGDVATCPDQLPADWIFCEDFESIADPADRFFEYNDAGGRFALVDDEGASGSHSMRVDYDPSTESGGWISVAFGRNPIVYGGSPHYAVDDDFDEIWWSLRLKMEPGWPDTGPHKVTRATAFAAGNWGQAMIAHLWSAGSDVTLLGDPASCVTGSTVDCTTYNDFDNLQWLGQMNGTTPLFSEALSGVWHCIEGHVALNTPGQADGVFEFWIDSNLENARSDLDWRGGWADYGINLVSFENYWNDTPPQALQRWMDDIVISTVPIGCN
jgi:hypothetical protein